MIGPQDFTSYAIGELQAHLVAAATEHPSAPVTQLIRAAAVATLPWDQYFRTPWDDPTFSPRFLYLRGRLTAGLDHEATLRQSPALAVLAELIAEIDKTEEPF